MASIIQNQCSQSYSGSTVTLTLAYTTNSSPVNIRLHGNPCYNDYIAYDVGGPYVGGIWYASINNLLPSSWITISVQDGDGSWSSPCIFYILDDQNHPSEKLPSYTPFIRHQWVRDDNDNNWIEVGICVASALSTMKEIHEYKEGKGSQQFYSIGWIYGNRFSSDSQSEGMMYVQALDKLKSDGTPPYKLLTENKNYEYPDNYFYTKTYPRSVTAKQLVLNNYSNVIEYAKPQRISSYTTYNSWYFSNIKSRIISDGCVLISVDLYNNCYPHQDGIFPEYKSGSFIDGHMMVVIGWKKINNKNYWICANSWGAWNGDSGLYYMPFINDLGFTFWFVTDGNYPTPTLSVPSAPLFDTSYGNNSDGRFEGGFMLKWGASSGATKYKVKVRRGYDGYIQEFSFGTPTS